jgi:anti-sigma B factor antagonist
MTVRAGHTAGNRIVGDSGAAPNGGIGAMRAVAANFALSGDGTTSGQLELQYQRTTDGQAMVIVAGELDIATAGQAFTYLRTVLESEKKGKLTLNLADLVFCDAAGLSVLAKLAAYARRTGRSVRLSAPRPGLVRIMRITGMEEAYPEICTPLLSMVPNPRQSAAITD